MISIKTILLYYIIIMSKFKEFEESNETSLTVYKCKDKNNKINYRVVLSTQKDIGLDGIGFTIKDAIRDAFIKKGKYQKKLIDK